jgi:hypothetical protein
MIAPDLLENALNNPIRRQHGFNILFADQNKAPKREWVKWQTQTQTDQDIRELYSSWGPGEATCWGFVCGYKGLEGFDFDWAWVYRLWCHRFKERADTLTVQTPNGGYRPFYKASNPITHDNHKFSLRAELKGPGRFVVFAGAALREDGALGCYKIEKDLPVKEDSSIVPDSVGFFEELLETRYSWLSYNCIKKKLEKKRFVLNKHEQRLAIRNFMLSGKCEDWEIHNFFASQDDYDERKTQAQIDDGHKFIEKGGKPFSCDKLRTIFNFSEKDCSGCPRRVPQPKKGEEETAQKRESQASALVKIAQAESVALFHDERQEPYIQIRKGEALVILRLRGKEARTWLSGLLWRDREKAPNSEALSSALNVLTAMANDGKEYRLYNRVAPGEDGSIWIDLCDDFWRAIHVTRAGWTVVDHPPILFRRYSHQQPIPVPVRGGSLLPLLDFANISHLGDQLLYVVTAITYLVPDIPHTIMILFGPQGSGKTWALLVIRDLVDPSQLGLLSLPTRYQEVVQNMDHNWCSFYDNVGRLPDWQSNVFCRAVTGTGVSKRQLYSDDDDVIYEFHRCIGLTDINIAAERGDLLQRSVLLGLDAIPEDRRKTERELRDHLDQQRPEILGAMLDVLVRAMNLYPTIKPAKLQRMADYTMWGLAITEALGIDPQHFIDAYQENIDAQDLEAVRASPISDALVLLMLKQPEGNWSGTVSQLYSALEDAAKELKISTSQKAWPKKPHALSRVLNDLTPSLPAVGLKVERGRAGNDRIIYINTVQSVQSVQRQSDWGKGTDLRAYLSPGTNVAYAPYALYGTYVNFTGDQPAPLPQSPRPDMVEAIVNREGSIGFLALRKVLEYRCGIKFHDSELEETLRSLASNNRIEWDEDSRVANRLSKPRGGESP